ncbi:MAG: PAS domain-containing protein [Ignavibacteriae bacterium]|nr:PAS domain-containing protein [Ignavibacteriota bacterium]
MKTAIRFSFFFCLMLCATYRTQAENIPSTEPWRWVLFTTETGLPSNRVLEIIETPDGTPWASTEFGLAWYDGYVWHTVRNKQDTLSPMTYTFLCNSRGTLYIEQDGKLFSGNKEGIRPLPVYYQGQRIPVTNSVYLEGYGILFIHNAGLFLLQDSVATPPPFFLTELNNETILNLFMGRNNQLWIISNTGMYSYHEGQLQKRYSFSGEPFKISKFIENKNGYGLMNLVGPSEAKGIWEWEPHGEPRYVREIRLAVLESFDISEENNALLAQSQGTVMQRVNNSWSEIAVYPHQMHNIVSLKYRSNGDLWMGTEQGLYLFKASSPRWKFVRYPSSGAWNNVNQILFTKDRSIWMATEEGIVIHSPNGTQKFIDKIGSQKIKFLTGLAEDSKGNVWVSSGSAFEGAFRWDGSAWKHVDYKSGLDAGFIHRIKQDRFGRLWFFGLERSDAVKRNVEVEPGAYVLSNGKFFQWGIQQGLPSGRVYSVDVEQNGTLWFGTLHGISKWVPHNENADEGTWQHWGKEQGLRLERIFEVFVDRNYRVWFCDQNSGLGYIENNQPKYFTTADGLVSNAVWEVKEDSSGKLWVSTRSGVSIYDGETWYSIDENDGLTNTRLWPIIPTKDFTYIGTYGSGMAILNMKELSAHVPKIVLSEPLFRENITHVHWNVFSYWGEQQNNMIETRYRLDNTHWSPWSTIRTVSLYDIGSGKHSLEVQTKKIFGNGPTLIESTIIDVPYPYYLRPSYYIPFGILALALLTVRVKYVIQKKKQASMLRQSEERYRTLAESARDVIFIIDRDNRVQYVNSYALNNVGLQAVDVIGKPWEQVIPFQPSEELRDRVVTALQEGTTVHFEHHTQFPNSSLWYSTLLTPLYNEQGEIMGLMGISRDITKSKQSEMETKLLVEELKTALTQIKTLKGLLPICSGCKKIRDDKGYWQQVDQYITSHTDATFTHGMCPDCAKIYFPDYKPKQYNSQSS